MNDITTWLRDQRKGFFTITEVSDIVGVYFTTLLKWEKTGQIPKPKRAVYGDLRPRLYSESDVQAIRERAQRIRR